MVKFNPDGSIKIPERFLKQKQEQKHRMEVGKCITISKQVVSEKSPKKCLLRIELSKAFTDFQFIGNTFNYFKDSAEVPATLKKINDREYEVEIGTCFKRCTDCCSLVNRFKDFLYGNLIEKKGSCTFESRTETFCYEDYFE